MPYIDTVRIKRENISERILVTIAENLMEDIYLVFHAYNSLRLSQNLKHAILNDVITRDLKDSVRKQSDFSKFYNALAKNIYAHIDYLRQIKKTSLLPPLYKEEMFINLMINNLDHEKMLHFPEEDYSHETLSQYDHLIRMYGDFPTVEDHYGRELRIQLHIVKNSTLHFADPEKKAELLEELLLQKNSNEFREFFIIDSLHRAMNMDKQVSY